MDVGLNYMEYEGYVFRTVVPKGDIERKKKEIQAAVGEILVRSVGVKIEKSKGREVDVVPEGEECLWISTGGFAERWTREHIQKAADKIRYLSGGEVKVELNRVGIKIDGNYEDILDEKRSPMYLFFDIDGVLNKESMWKTNYSLDDEMIENLGLLCFWLNAELVLMSSWRTGFKYSLSDENLEPIQRIENILFDKYGKRIIGKTDILKGRKRDDEIERYRMLHDETLEYAVLDDDPGEYGVIKERMYFTDPKKGLTIEDVEKMRKKYGGILC